MKRLNFKVCDRQNHCTGMVVTLAFTHDAFRHYCESTQRDEPLVRNALHRSFDRATPGNERPVEVIMFAYFMAVATPYIYAIVNQLHRNLTILLRTPGFFAPDAIVASEAWTTENAELSRAAGLKIDSSPTRALRSGDGAISMYTVALHDWDILRDDAALH